MLENRRWLIVIFIFALIIRIFFILFWLQERLYWDDEFAYDRLATQLIEKHCYQNEEGKPTAFRPPAYPLFLALNYLLWGRHFWAARMFQAFIDCLTLVLVYLIAKRIFNPKTAVLSASIYSFYPLLIYTASTFFPTTLSIFLLALFIYLLVSTRQQRSFWKLMFIGIIAGLSVLTVPTFLAFIFLALGWLYFDLREVDPRRFFPIGIMVIFMTFTMLPWLIRNYCVFNQPFVLSTNSGYNFWMGNNTWATPTTGNSIRYPDYLAKELTQAKSEVEQEKIFYQDALQYIKKNPGKFILLTFKKAVNLWQLYPTPTTGYKMMDRLSKLMSVLSYGPILLFAIFGLIISWRDRKEYTLLFVLLFVSFTISYAFFITKTRFRLPLDPYLIMLASFAIAELGRKKKNIKLSLQRSFSRETVRNHLEHRQ
ncbi:MAG: glycosyltransferase family 39 protein [candidate division KSB1 bacterium]|nr:glycosyltransferase family 39 protein [candidate division KSB1 bacterium]MDZ7358207.1 glycosyltransferase family 39 protein [candidate division KSB1 bacterium]MDZ7399653.1 glycosyltransferase family 39 protein [candidate division KSB1 bacterium]